MDESCPSLSCRTSLPAWRGEKRWGTRPASSLKSLSGNPLKNVMGGSIANLTFNLARPARLTPFSPPGGEKGQQANEGRHHHLRMSGRSASPSFLLLAATQRMHEDGELLDGGVAEAW